MSRIELGAAECEEQTLTLLSVQYSLALLCRDLKAKKIRCLSPEPRIGAHGKPVMFLHPKDCAGVLIELEQA